MLEYVQKRSKSRVTTKQEWLDILAELNKHTTENALVNIRYNYDDGTSIYIDCENEEQAKRICSDLQSCKTIHFDADSTKAFNSDFAINLKRYMIYKDKRIDDRGFYVTKPVFTLIYDHVRKNDSQKKLILEKIRVKEEKRRQLDIDLIDLRRQLNEAYDYDLSRMEEN